MGLGLRALFFGLLPGLVAFTTAFTGLASA